MARKKIENDIMSLIQKYRLNEEEILALNISQYWALICKKYFPDYQHIRLKSGDPRKSIIFKICYKLQRETKGLVPIEEYELYVRAQLEILKFQSQNNPMVLVDPMCLVGEKAWKRWKLWKKKYDQKLNSSGTIVPQNFGKLGSKKAIEGLIKTKKFFEQKFKKSPNISDLNKEDLINWINFGKISPYYIVISPYMKKIFDDKELVKLNFDPSLYENCIDKDVKKIFSKLFGYEK
jgi:hypothetical protein